ncbi:type II secretion system protein GspJ [Sphingomonas naphthae]|uniref:Type II secretion system protein J n=1 Tax=Sphingomonas naphthae TaxID=1813468 RepID=A0ABY7TI19_9SPHN|nr:type II secretion system protein GspJ [Sphingomonas naphthae]WCT72871.1 type II secretion system protein GspJ [Sphingomonas naphthae]
MIIRPEREAGFTLIEMLISLALFALIAAAGIALVESILSVQARTSGRLERLGDVQRAMFVLSNDLGQVAGGPVKGDGATISFVRPLAASLGQPQPVAYTLSGGMLGRMVGGAGAQALLGGVAGVRWRYYGREGGWQDRWPPNEERKDERPEAIEVQLTLAPGPNRPAGTIRRVVALPARP